MKKLACLISLLIIVSCSDSADDAASGVIMPLKVGNYWTFVDSSFDDLGNFIWSDTSTLSITGKKTIEYQSQSYEVYLWTWITGLDEYSWLAWNGEDGMYLFGGVSPKQDYILTKTLSVKYPVDVNDVWEKYNISFTTFDSSFYISDTLTMSCISKNTTMASPLGGLSTYVYEYSRMLSKAHIGAPDMAGQRVEKGILGKMAATSITKIFYVAGVGYVGLINETNGIITYKKTIIDYLADK